MIRYTCPSPDRWTALLGDNLPADEQLDLQAHLDSCPECQRVLETCAADRASWAAVPRWLGSCSNSDAKLQTVIDRLKHSLGESPDTTDMTLDFLDRSEREGSLGRINNYEVIEEIGRGGMGVVLKALDPALHRVVAIKVLAPQLAVSGSARKRFTREARAAAAVCHEHVVTIHAVEEFKTLPYLVMHYIAGQSLQQKLDAHGPLPVADILRIGTQAAAGLAAAHAQGLVHRDVKPANILLENGVERVRLSDFGLARAIDDAAVTQSGVITGTPQYMAPEQARGEPLDARADLFSLGSVLYAMCTGSAPFRGGNALDVLRKVGEETPRPIREQNPEIPAWLEAIVTKLMAKEPSQRYHSAGEVAELLERCLAHVQNPAAEPLPPLIDRFAAVRAPARRALSRWAAIALPILAGLFVVSEATGTTQVVKALGTVLRFRTPEGTLIVEIDDPAVKVTLDDKDLVITGTGAQEVRLKPGSYTVHAARDGRTATQVVSIAQDGKTTVRVSFEGGGLHVSSETRDPAATRRSTSPQMTAPAQPLGPAPRLKGPASADVPTFKIEFRDQPWGKVFEWLTEVSGQPVVSNSKPTGTFTFIQAPPIRGYTLVEIVDLLNESLMQQHFLLVRRSKNFMLVPTDEKIDPTYFINVPTHELEQRGKTELVNYIVKVDHVRAADARATLQALQSPLGRSVTIPGGGLSISDMAENVRRIVGRLTELERQRSATPKQPHAANEPKFTFEFRDAPWSEVTKELARISNRAVIQAKEPSGTFIHVAPKQSDGEPRQYTLSEAIDIVNDALRKQNLLLLKQPTTLMLIEKDDRPAQSLEPAGKGPIIPLPTFAFEFRNEPWSNVLNSVSKLTGLSVVANAKPTGTFSFIPPKQVQGKPREFTLPEIFDILNDALMQQKLLLVRRASQFLLVQTDERIDPSLFPDVSLEELSNRGRTELVSVFFTLARASKNDVANVISPMLSSFGRVGKPERMNAVIICDTAANVQTIVRVLGELDKGPSGGAFALANEGKSPEVTPLVPPSQPTNPTGGRSAEPLRIGDKVTVAILASDAPIALVLDSALKDGLQIRDVATGKERARLAIRMPPGGRRGQSSVPHFALSADGERIAVTMFDMLTIYDGATGKTLKDSTVHAGEISAVAFGAQGKLVATAGKTDEQVRIWDVASGNEVRQFRGFTSPATVLAFAPGGTKLLASDGRIIKVFSVATGEELDYRVPMGGSVNAAAFSAEGQVVAIAGRTLLVWRPEKDAKVEQIEANADLTALAVTPDGRSALVSKRDGSIDLYRLANGRLVFRFNNFGPVRGLSISPDSQSFSVISESPDGAMLIGTKPANLADTGMPPPKK